MEYIQTVLFQVPVSLLGQASEAGGLFPEVDEHRNFLREQTGFRDIRVTRSINSEGSVLVLIETRWDDDESLLRYETREPNSASIVRRHQNVIVPDSLQVLDMEALRTEESWPRKEVSPFEGSVLPMAAPAAALAFALLLVYGLSRVYLELPDDGAVGLAVAVAAGVLLTALYLAVRPRAPAWHIGGILALAAVVLTGGAIWASIEAETAKTVADGAEASAASTPAPPTPGAPAGGQTITMGDNYFEFEGQRNPAITIPAGQEVTFNIHNKGLATHNMHVAAPGGYAQELCKVGGPEPCSNPNLINGGQTATITITLAAGTYDFRCDFGDGDQQNGRIIAQ